MSQVLTVVSRLTARLACPTLALVLLLLAACSKSAAPVDAPTSPDDCFWVGPYTHLDPQTNTAFPDTHATYRSARFTLPADAQLQLSGAFPYARYMSITAYDRRKSPTGSLFDAEIRPMPGSSNPFVAGAARNTTPRNYQLTAARDGDGDAINLLHIEQGREDREVTLVYRVYVPDAGQPETGGVDLPRVRLVQPVGPVKEGSAACAALRVDREILVRKAEGKRLYSLLRGQPWRDEAYPARASPVWRRFFNPVYFERCGYLGWCGGHPDASGGTYSNAQNGYLSLFANRSFGPLLVLEGQMPETPRTTDGNGEMPVTALRYWSLCSNETYTQMVADCLYDEQVTLDDARRYTIVVGRADDRPENARAACGVTWLDWPADGDGAGHPDDALLLLRNMLPGPAFQQSVLDVETPGDEAEVLGPYLPTARYLTAEDFADRSCPSG